MRLRPGDRVIIQFDAGVLAVHHDGGRVIGYEFALAGHDPDDPLLVPMEALSSTAGPRVEPVVPGAQDGDR